jgi:dipeptidyl aminopeptidase/acylaminoacyl peptidase
MKHFFLVFCLMGFVNFLSAQKKPLDHTVYDSWQSVGDRLLSNDGKYILFNITPQEGDANLILQSVSGNYKKEFARGYAAEFSEDSRFLIFKIKPTFKETRDAKIKKKKPEEMPKDSLAYIELGKDSIVKIPRIKSFKLPEDSGVWLAWLAEKATTENKPKAELDSAARMKALITYSDSLLHVVDSIRLKVYDAKLRGMSILQTPKKTTAPKSNEDPIEEGTELTLRNLSTGEQLTFKLVTEYFFNKKGNTLVYETSKKTIDSLVKPLVVKLDLIKNTSKTIFQNFNDAKGYRMDEDGTQLAFVAERDSSTKALLKFYKLYYFKDGSDSVKLLADKTTLGMPVAFSVSDNPNIVFSKNGKQLYFGTAPILPAKDTSLPDFERVAVDVWHYNDDYLQPMQLKNLEAELKKSHVTRFDFEKNAIVQLGSPDYRSFYFTNEGDGAIAYAVADKGKRVAMQWQGFLESDLYAIHVEDGQKDLIQKDVKGNVFPSYTGRYLVIYDEKKRSYSAYNAEAKKFVGIAKDLKVPLYDVENDVPDDPNAYGVFGWLENDAAIFMYDEFDIWQVDPQGLKPSICITGGLGRKNKITYRNIVLDKEEKFYKKGQQLLFSAYNNTDKTSGLVWYQLDNVFVPSVTYPARISAVVKAKQSNVFSYASENYQHAADIRVATISPNNFSDPKIYPGTILFEPNPQQQNYNWGTAELFKWKAYTGKDAEGIVYKPEDFDPKKKYPMIVYFYERNNNTLYNYNAPAPTPSRLNIPFYVSRGYIVFVPDIWYKTGYPGQGAYDYIVSGTRAVVKQGYVDSTKLGLQGQSWGGFQIVYLITKTNLYAAAWAGAPVANMTSAYGGIRWGSGMNRQFQYEKTQSRIGATLWEKPNLYLQNSALFSLPKVTTPLVIMANDADDAVPWYQGIEMFTGMRRLGKKVWMLNYNNEAHNLVERRNRKDIQIREQQFFDYLLKGEKPAKWISDGVPAVMKGRDWGLEVKSEK